jgi:hypothetical protein
MKEHMQKSFNQPTPYALNLVQAVPATIKDLSSAVPLKNFAGKGTPAERYLGPEIIGGPRRPKRSELALRSIGALSAGGFASPGDAASLDQYGNQKSAEIVKILSILKAFGEQGYRANRTKSWSKKTRAGQIFVVKQSSGRGGLKPGVYRRTAGGVVPLMVFLSKVPTYRPRLPFDALVAQDARRVFPEELKRAIEEMRR